MLFPIKFSEEALASMARYWEAMDRAKEMDPEAFKPVMLPHFTEEQKWRQHQAIERARRDDPLPVN